MSSTNNKTTAPRRSGINALKQIAQGTDLNEYFTPTEIGRMAQTHPELGFKIRETGVLAHHRTEWLIRWHLPMRYIEEIEDVRYFVTIAPTEEIALQHFILADTADQGVIDGLLESVDITKELGNRYKKLKSQLVKNHPQLLTKYPQSEADRRHWFMSLVDLRTAKAIQPTYHAFLQANLRDIVENVWQNVIVTELQRERYS